MGDLSWCCHKPLLHQGLYVMVGLLLLSWTHQMVKKSLTHSDVHSWGGDQELSCLMGTGAVAMPELGKVFKRTPVEDKSLSLAELVQVSHCQLQDVCLLKLGHILPLGLQTNRHNILQFIKTGIDSSPSLSLQQGLCDFLILISLRNRCCFYVYWAAVCHNSDFGVCSIIHQALCH